MVNSKKKTLPKGTKADLVKKVLTWQINHSEKLVKKILRHAEQFSKDQIAHFRASQKNHFPKRWKIDWTSFQGEVKKIVNQWQKKEVSTTIEQFLAEIKVSLKANQAVTLYRNFSLKTKTGASRQRCSKHQKLIDDHKLASCCDKKRGIVAYAQCPQFKKKIAQPIKKCQQCLAKTGSSEKKKRISFRLSPNFKQAVIGK